MEVSSIFYEDGTRLNDIVLLLRFFLGNYVCLEHDVVNNWNKFNGDALEHPILFKKSVLPKIIYILETLNKEKVKKYKIDKLILLNLEVYKTQYLDVKIAILSPIINILVDIYTKDVGNKDESAISSLVTLKEKILVDVNYSEGEKQNLTIAISKMINSLGTDFTTKTIYFIQRLKIINMLELDDSENKIKLLAQLFNALRNGILHSGNLNTSGIERKFKQSRRNIDEETFKGKVRVYSTGIVLVQDAILEILGITDYYYKEQNIIDLQEYFNEGTFRGF